MLRIPTKPLNQALKTVAGVVPGRSTNQYLTYIRFEATPNGIVLAGSDSTTDLEVTVQADVQAPIERVLVPRGLVEFAAALPGNITEIARDEKGLSVMSGPAFSSFSTSSPDSYPDLLAGFEPGPLTLEASELFRLLEVAYACSAEEYRAVLRGVQLESTPGKLAVVASDGYRLAKTTYEGGIAYEGKHVLPGDLVRKVLPRLGLAGQVRVGFKLGKIFFESHNLRASSSLMEGEYPDYDRVIPQSFVATIEVKREALIEALKRVAMLSDRSNTRVDITWSVESETMTLKSSGDFGRAEESLSLINVTGSAIEVCYNAEYLIEALAHMHQEVARLELSGSTSPTLVRGDKTLAVVVPLRV